MKYRVLTNYQTQAHYFGTIAEVRNFMDDEYAKLGWDKGEFLEDEDFSEDKINDGLRECNYFEFCDGDCVEQVEDDDVFTPDLADRDLD